MNKRLVAVCSLIAFCFCMSLIFVIYKFNSKLNYACDSINKIMSEADAERNVSVENVTTEVNAENDSLLNVKINNFTDGHIYTVYQLPPQTGGQLMSYVIVTDNDQLIVIDGGWKNDGEYLADFIKQHGGVVEAWIITHPHVDHVGALIYNCSQENNNGLTINNVYYSPFTYEFFHEEAEGKDLDTLNQYSLFDEFDELMKQEKNINFISVNQNDEITIDGINIECLHSFRDDVYDVNSNSLVLKFDIKGTKMLFTGDITENSIAYMVQCYGIGADVWHADFLQAPHHAFGGVSSIYELVSPKYVMVSCTQKQYYDRDSNGNIGRGGLGTLASVGIISSLGMKQLRAFDGIVSIEID